MGNIETVNPLCGCVTPVVPTTFDNGCMTIPEQVNKLTYKTNEVIGAVNDVTAVANDANEKANNAVEKVDNALEQVPEVVQEYVNENGSPKLNPGALIDGIRFTGEKSITHVGYCQTAAAVGSKTFTLISGEAVENITAGFMVAIRFVNGTNEITGATLGLEGSNTAYPIKYNGVAGVPEVPNIGYLIVHFDGLNFNVVGGSQVPIAGEAEKLKDGQTINGVPFTGETAITIACTTTSAANASEKIVQPGSQSGVALQNGSVILVRFLSGNTAEGAVTFRIGGANAEAKNVYYNGSTAGLPSLPSNAHMLFTYANNSWIGQFIGTGGGGGAGGDYVLPVASATQLGGVKVGAGIDVTADGIISVDSSELEYELPVASNTVLGGIKVGQRLTIQNGVLSADEQGGTYTLPTASDSVKGGIKVGNGFAVSNEVLNIQAGAGLEVTGGQVVVKPATAAALGGVKSGKAVKAQADGTMVITTASGLEETANGLNLKPATASTLGGVMAGTGLSVTAAGTLGVKPATNTVLGSVKVGTGLNVDSNGTLSNGYVFEYDESTSTLNITTSEV